MIIVLRGKIEMKEGKDYSFDKETGVITFLKPVNCASKKRWWLFWKRPKQEKITIIYKQY